MKYENGTWEIVDTFTNEVLAYTNGTSHIPIGMNQWHFPQSKCSDEGKDYRTLSFHKYVEQPGHYCCNDGTCFNSELVCDGAQNCESGEDEQDCQMIDIPSAYNKLLPRSEVIFKKSSNLYCRLDLGRVLMVGTKVSKGFFV